MVNENNYADALIRVATIPQKEDVCPCNYCLDSTFLATALAPEEITMKRDLLSITYAIMLTAIVRTQATKKNKT